MNRIVFLCCLLFLGCDECCLNQMEIIPGVTLEWYDYHYSRVVSKRYGMLAEGEIFITFYEYGIGFCGRRKSVYVDLINDVIRDGIENQLALKGNGLVVFDASCAMGVSSRKAYCNFQTELHKLNERVKNKKRMR